MNSRGDDAAAAPAGPDASPRSVAGNAISEGLRELSESFQLHDRALAGRMGLKPQEYRAMAHILMGGGQLGPVELAARLGLAAPTTSELIDRLEHFGHARRQPDPNDRRRVKLSPTESAITAIVAAVAPAVRETDRLADDFTPAEQETIVRFLAAASAAFRDRAAASD